MKKLISALMVMLCCNSSLMAATCDYSLNGKWILDFDNYLDEISKGNPEVRTRASQIQDGQAFIKIQFSGNRGEYSQRGSGGWSSFSFSYDVSTLADNSCILSIEAQSESAASMRESLKIWTTNTGFCLRTLTNTTITDCYIRDE